MSGNMSSVANNEYKPPDNDSNHVEERGKFTGKVWEQEYWIQCEIVLSLLTLFGVYAFICILRYTTMKKSTPSRDTSGKQGRRLYIMLVMASAFTVLRLVSDHVVAFTSSIDDTYCFTTIVVSTVMYALGLLFIYIFLWMRQSIFYANPVLSKVLNKWVTIVSWSTLIVMISCGVCMLVLYNLPEINGWIYKVTEDGCKGLLIGDDEIVAAVATALTVYFQISLLALFLYPLLSRKTQKYRSAGSQNNEVTKGNGSMSNTDDNLTDGDASSSVRSGRFKIPTTKKKDSDNLPLSENESGIDIRGDSGNFSKSSSRGDVSAPENIPKESESQEQSPEIVADKATEKTKLSEKQKRPSLMFTPKFLKSGNLFYRRNQARNGTDVPQSPTAKRSRAKTLSSSASTENGSERNTSVGSQSKKMKRKQRKAKRTQQGRRMMAYLRKSFYIMMVCVITDIVCTVIQARVNVPELVYLVIFDLNLIINLISIVMSFRDWDLILFPFCARSSSKRHSSSMIGSTKATPDHAASKRRVEALKSSNLNGCSSPGLNSPRLPAKSDSAFSYDATEAKSQDGANVKRGHVNLNGKT